MRLHGCARGSTAPRRRFDSGGPQPYAAGMDALENRKAAAARRPTGFLAGVRFSTADPGSVLLLLCSNETLTNDRNRARLLR